MTEQAASTAATAVTPAAVSVLPATLSQKNVLNSATLIIGSSGSGKSSLLYTLAVYVWETFHLVTLYYSSDGGGFPTQVQALVNRGIIRLWRMRTRSADGLAFETCQRASQGWWPKEINPLTGESAPAVTLVPPVSERFVMRCAQGHIVKVVPFQALLTPTLCPVCKKLTSKADMVVERSTHRTRGFEQVGAAVYDGISSMCSWMLQDMSKRTDLGGEKSRLGGSIASGDLAWNENNRAQVGFAQNRAEELALNSLGVPGLVVPPVWTALVHETSDEGGLQVRGPMIAGQAKTSVAPQWFGNCLETVVVQEGPRKYRRLNLAEYVDSSGVRHLCKTRAVPKSLPAYLQDEDNDDPASATFDQFNLGTFHRLLDEALKKAEQEIQARFPDAPGLPSGTVQYGDVSEVVAGAAGVAGVASTPTTPSVAGITGKAAVTAPVGGGGGGGGPVAAPSAPAPRPATPRAAAPRATAAKPAATPVASAPTPASTPAPVASAAATGPQAPTPISKGPAKAAVPPPPGARPAG